MKRNKFSLSATALIIALGATSCLQEQLTAPQSSEGVQLTFEAVRADGPSTKTQIGGEDMTEILWSPGDAISVFYGEEGKQGGTRFDSNLEEPASVASFSGTLETVTGTVETAPEATVFRGVYPFSTNNFLRLDTLYIHLSNSQKAVAGSVARGGFPSVGRSEGLRMAFYNVLGGIRFTVDRDRLTTITLTGNNGEYLCGTLKTAFGNDGLPVSLLQSGGDTITLTAPEGGFFEVGKPYFIAIPPVTFEKGFTMTFSNQFYTGTRVVENPVEIVRSEFKLMTDADKEVDYEPVGDPVALADKLSGQLLDVLAFSFIGEHSYAFTNYGTDEFMVAGDPSNGMWNDYDSRLGAVVSPMVNSNTVKVDAFWNSYYDYIGRANELLCFEDEIASLGNGKEALGTAAFIRAYCYLFLTMQHGDIPLVMTPDRAPVGEWGRNSREEIYAQVISDLEKAYDLLPADASLAVRHGVSKYAVAHYLAKAHLWRASEINDDWNARYKASDLDAVIRYADEVIAAHPLAGDYSDLFGNFTGYDTSITETNTEIVLAAEFNRTAPDGFRLFGNLGLALFTARYQSFPLMKRDLAGAREYQRMKTTPSYAYFLYDLENDSRFWKSFKTTYAVNNATGKDIKVQGTTYKDNVYFPSNDGEYLSSMYIINRKDYGQKYYKSEVNVAKAPSSSSYTREDYHTGKLIPNIMALYIYDENGNVVGTSMTPDYNTLLAPLCKYLDGAVPANNRGDGFRDGVLARSAEDYFFKAEAQIRKGNIDAGLATLKPLRDRAQYKAGEQRDAYVDGGNAYHYNTYKSGLKGFQANCAFYPWNSYYYSLGGWDDKAYRDATNAKPSVLPVVTSASYPKEDQAIMDKLGYSSEFDKAMCYLLNEKSREMYGEYLRWMDLARTKTLEKRLVFNDQAYSKTLTDITGSTKDVNGTTYAASDNGGNFKASKHYYRPIPQDFLDNIYKDGKPLTADEKQALQNPGY